MVIEVLYEGIRESVLIRWVYRKRDVEGRFLTGTLDDTLCKQVYGLKIVN